ncbi:LLM class flavin-dependent oxidoreductase [Amycolatopsis sp.]|uniref:LLM class flavin-dependent oxidoreductase n=1 Tax=Amycolatopsis sp. TaxID=37632 RepID=UPI002CC148F9|nr:LLM class flavin-dependent oxidoreductase [Amycolatopsis sp.]HVV12704.1 LLM class flavin-dependent oxidoreductase [Amycolatopsis sp.]
MEWGLPWPGAEIAAEAEKAGAAAFCAGEFADHNAYLSTAEMAAGTTTAQVGPGIAYAFARSPFVHASAIRHLSKTAPGRLFLGLGAGTRRMNQDWFVAESGSPAKRMAELITAIRAYLTAENWSHIETQGEFYPVKADIRAPVLGRLDVPILVGAFNKIMIRTVGRAADGVLGHGLFTDAWWSEVVEPALAAGAAETGRDAAEIRRWGWVITAINDEDPDRARLDARRQIAFYLTVKTYDRLVELHGWQAQVEAIRQAFRAGDNDAMAAAVTDEMLAEIAVCGTTGEALATIDRRKALPQLAFLATPSFLVGPKRQAHYARAAVATMEQLDRR